MDKNNKLQIGKAGEYLACADMIIKGLVAYPSEQGLPYDLVVDNGKRLLKCQVKTTIKPRVDVFRDRYTRTYFFNLGKVGKYGKVRYDCKDVDIFALAELETRKIAYLDRSYARSTISLRLDRLRGTYHDEKSVSDFSKVITMHKDGMSQAEISRSIGLHFTTVCRMLKKGYHPPITSAKYFSDLHREVEWFHGI